jgi:transcriptional regulator with XRE-family HTH domain
MVNVHDRSKRIEDTCPEERNLRVALGKRISQIRKKKRWTQAELASKLEVTRFRLRRWERGALPPLRVLNLLSEILETSLDVLLAGREADRKESLTQDQKKKAAQHLNQLAGLLQLRSRESRD